MKWSSAMIFIVLFLLVGSFCLWVEFPQKASQPAAVSGVSSVTQSPAQKPALASKAAKETTEEVYSPNLLDLLPDDRLTLIQIQDLEAKKTLKLVLDQDHWLMKFPAQDEAELAKVQELVNGLLSIQKLQQMKPEKGWEEYGLARPKMKIGIETALKPVRRYLYLGNVSPIGNVLFARWEDEKTYFLLPAAVQGLFEGSAYAFREKRLFLKHGESPRRIQLHTETGNYEIENQGTQWVWKDPEAMRWTPCPAGDAETLLEKLRGLFVKDFLEEAADEENGLAQSGTRITVGIDETRSEVLEVGKEAGVRDAFYARRGGQGGTLLVARDKLNAFFDLFRALAAQKLIQS